MSFAFLSEGAFAEECGCGCAGIFTATNTMACLAQVFEEENALDKLAAFTSENGPAWYGLPVNETKLTLVRHDEPVEFPSHIQTGAGTVTVWDQQDGKSSTWNRLRPDCWLSTIPASGMLLSPEGGGGCSCGTWMETSVGFIPRQLKRIR